MFDFVTTTIVVVLINRTYINYRTIYQFLFIYGSYFVAYLRNLYPDVGLGWLRWLRVQLLILAQVMIPRFMGWSPVLGSVLSMQPAWDSLSSPPLLSRSLSLTQINKH